ncbi:MAG: T9SS type A sorting domain-containing protein [Bacteroidetes bacterium]|nr:T9SS type A sorting domain-containing protein [Bacteroidota bacterium]
MKKITTLLLAITLSCTLYAQNMLSNGFGFMAAINGNTYTKTSNLGAQNFQFVCASSNGAYFYAVNFSTSTIFIINSSTYAFVDSFTGPTPHYITASNEPNMLFTRGNQSLLRYNPSTKSLTDSVLMPNLWGLTERPNSKEIWVTVDSNIKVVNYASSLTITNTIKTSNNQYDNFEVAFTPMGTICYQSASSKKKIYKIDANTKAIVDSINTAPYSFQQMVTSADSSKLYGFSNTKLYAIDLATKAITDSSMVSNKQIMHVYRHPNRAELWAVHHFNDSVTAFNETTKATIASFGIGPSPFYLAFAVGSTGINQVSENNTNVLLYPNPANTNINLAFDNSNKREIVIYNSIGTKMAAYNTNNNTATLDITSLATGNYFVTVKENNELVKTLTFIKE